MDANVAGAVRELLDTQRVLSLAVVVDNDPVAALLPFALGDDYSTLLVHASGLARHTRGLFEGASIGVLIHEPATPDVDPMQVPRLTVQATVRVVQRETPAFQRLGERLVARFPAARTTLALGDFVLCRLELGRGRYVRGFAQATNVGTEWFKALGSPPAA
jgi:putative heme iron utilization protein